MNSEDLHDEREVVFPELKNYVSRFNRDYHPKKSDKKASDGGTPETIPFHICGERPNAE